MSNLNNATTAFGTVDSYVKRIELGEQEGPALNNSAGGIIPGAVLALGNFASGGSLGAASATVDSYSIIEVAQTTASQTVTLSSPTTTSETKMVFILNTGSQTFTIFSTSVTAGAGLIALWPAGAAAWYKVTL